MEKEKRKRGEKERKEKKSKNLRKEEETTEREVEEFFAILKRMRAVVKYFEKAGAGEGWRKAVEADRRVVVVADDDAAAAAAKDGFDNNDKKREAMEASGVFDLNAAPKEEEEDNQLADL